MPRGANVISICPILMAMSFHLLVRSSGPLRAQGESPLQRPEQEFAGELANPVLGFFGEYCAIVSKTNPATLIAVGITPGDVPRRGGTPATTGLGRRIENGVQIETYSEDVSCGYICHHCHEPVMGYVCLRNQDEIRIFANCADVPCF
jgi:hypothetical protein